MMNTLKVACMYDSFSTNDSNEIVYFYYYYYYYFACCGIFTHRIPTKFENRSTLLWLFAINSESHTISLSLHLIMALFTHPKLQAPKMNHTLRLQISVTEFSCCKCRKTLILRKIMCYFYENLTKTTKKSTKMWVKVKFALEQTVNVQSRSRGIAVLFL
jgi:hypothetical protein